MSEEQQASKEKWGFRLIALSIGMGLSALLLWAFLPSDIWQFGARLRIPPMAAHDLLNHAFLANTTIPCPTVYDSNEGDNCTFVTNSLGWKSRQELVNPKAAGRVRVFVVGDSFVEGLTDNRYTMPALLESRLAPFFQRHGKKLEVFNTGVSSYSTLVYLVLIRDFLLPLEPDLLVVNMDHSDVVDDWIYESAAQYDASGKLLGVGSVGIKSARSELHPFKRLAWAFDGVPEELEKQIVRSMEYLTQIIALCQEKKVPVVVSLTAAQQHLDTNVGRDPGLVGHGVSTQSYETVRATTESADALYFDAYRTLKKRFGDDPGSRYMAGNPHFGVRGHRDWADALAEYLVQHREQVFPGL